MQKPPADREVNRARCGELGGDLEAGVTAADHEHVSGGDLFGTTVPRAVKLRDLGRQIAGEGGNGRLLERARRDDDPVGSDRAGARLERVSVGVLVESEHLGRRPNRQLERGRIELQVLRYLVLRRIVVIGRRKAESRKRAEPPRREQPQGVPP